MVENCNSTEPTTGFQKSQGKSSLLSLPKASILSLVNVPEVAELSDAKGWFRDMSMSVCVGRMGWGEASCLGGCFYRDSRSCHRHKVNLKRHENRNNYQTTKEFTEKIFNRQLVYITHRFLLVLFFFFPKYPKWQWNGTNIYIFYQTHKKPDIKKSKQRMWREEKGVWKMMGTISSNTG